MSSHPATVPTPRPAGGPGGSSAVWKVVVLLLGIAVGVLAIAAVAAVQAADQARDEVDAAAQPANAAAPAVHDHAAQPQRESEPADPELRRDDGRERRRACEGARRVRRDATAGPAGRPREDPHDPEGHGRRDRAGREVQHLGVRRPRRSRPDPPRAAGPDRPDDADERRHDPSLDRLPRGADRAEPRVQGRSSR